MSYIDDIYKCVVVASDGKEYEDMSFDKTKVVAVKFVSDILPTHVVSLEFCKFVKRFRRVSQKIMNVSTQNKEVIHCVVTDVFRVYLKSSTGQVIVTSKDFEMYS